MSLFEWVYRTAPAERTLVQRLLVRFYERRRDKRYSGWRP